MDQPLVSSDSGKSSGFGFVCFKRHEDAQRAVNEMNRKELNRRLIYVGRAQKKGERQTLLKLKFGQRKPDPKAKYRGINLFVKNLDDAFDDHRLRKEFSAFGTIISAKEATKAVTEINGRIVGTKLLDVALAQSKAQRQQYLADRDKQCHGSAQPIINSYQPPIPQTQTHAAAYYFSNQLAQLSSSPGMMPVQRIAPTADAATAMSKPKYKYALTLQGRLKFLHGQNYRLDDGCNMPPQLALFAIATPLQPPSILEIRTKNMIFRTKHKLDFTPMACDA
ncbi:unnamed protein product, partial [Coregonus sp. 'balchen']